jgi:hypothetical protein
MKKLYFVDTANLKLDIQRYMNDVLSPSPDKVCKIVDDHTFIMEKET